MNENKDTIVTTKSGRLEGDYLDGLYMFKGIPYAAPPVGELRWLPPQPVTPWEGIRPAKEFGAVAPQNKLPGAEILDAFDTKGPQSEDCLFLNILTPGLDNAKRPVMFWIHGGAFIIGSSSQETYTKGSLAKRGNVVLVSINYRMGALGFMNLNEITQGKIPATGNEGLLDQVAALEWVQDNIAAFGGDPDDVTVFGESAGGMSIGCLLGMPAAQGKFHKAILESGAANTVSMLDYAIDAAKQYLEILGINSNDVESMRSLTVEQILAAQQALGNKMRETHHRVTPFQPIIDGKVIPERPIDAIKKGSAKNIPVLIGTNLEEWKLFSLTDPGVKNMDEADLIKRLQTLMPAEHVPGIVEAYRDVRKKRGEPIGPVDLLTAINTDWMFRMPAIRLIEARQKNNEAAYNYLFTWKSPAMGGVFGACHALEIGFLFGSYSDIFCGSGPDADALSLKMQDAWLAFAHTGDPSCETIGPWPPYGDRRTTMMLGKECHVEDAPYDAERSAWDNLTITMNKPI